jgi:hypothetical protein
MINIHSNLSARKRPGKNGTAAAAMMIHTGKVVISKKVATIMSGASTTRRIGRGGST